MDPKFELFWLSRGHEGEHQIIFIYGTPPRFWGDLFVTWRTSW